MQRNGHWQVEGDPTEGALVTLAARAGLDPANTRAGAPRLAVIPFDPAYRYMATLHERGDATVAMVKGASYRTMGLAEGIGGVRQFIPRGATVRGIGFRCVVEIRQN